MAKIAGVDVGGTFADRAYVMYVISDGGYGGSPACGVARRGARVDPYSIESFQPSMCGNFFEVWRVSLRKASDGA